MRATRRRRGDLTKAAALELRAKLVLDSLGVRRETDERFASPSVDGNRFGLTGREIEVLALVAQGLRNSEIAEALTLSVGTVQRHLQNIYGKMDANGRAEAVMKAVNAGVLGPLPDSAESVHARSQLTPDPLLRSARP
jgi:DNA-binding NarL/FixJ family response regulator